MFEKALVLSATAGAGHVRAGQAIAIALTKMQAARQVQHVDILQYTNPLFRKVYAQAYLSIIRKSPMMFGWLYNHTDKPFTNKRMSQVINKFNTRPFVRYLNRYQPDITICTHFLPSEIIAGLKRKHACRCPLAIAVTDFEAHAMWLVRDCDHYFLAIPETAECLKYHGVPAERLSITGIPIDPVFAQSCDQIEIRRKIGLIPDRTTLLVTFGGFSTIPIENLLNSLRKIQHPVQIVAICGKNEALRRRLTAQFINSPASAAPIHIVGFTNEMDQYMAASNILIGKPGGLTISEALARGLVMCIVNPIPGQEERNSDHLLEAGAAIRCHNLAVLPWKIDQLLADPQRLAAMKHNVRRLAHPDSAALVVRKLLELQPTFTPNS